MDKQKQAIRQVLDTLERLPPLVRGVKEIMHSITALREALAEQVHTPYCKQAPMCKTPCGNSDCVEQATVSGGLCGGCAKKAADGWALYCVECWEKAEQEQPEPEGICQEPDGCPTEKAVLQRFWREKQAEQEPVKRFTSDDVKVAFENGYAAAMSVADVAKEVDQEPDGLEKTLRAILQPAAPFEQMFSTQGEVKMSNNNMREIGYAFVNHAGEFQFVPGAAENIPVNAIMVYTTEDNFQKACDSARELADKFYVNDSKSFREGYELGKQAIVNKDGK